MVRFLQHRTISSSLYFRHLFSDHPPRIGYWSFTEVEEATDPSQKSKKPPWIFHQPDPYWASLFHPRSMETSLKSKGDLPEVSSFKKHLLLFSARIQSSLEERRSKAWYGFYRSLFQSFLSSSARRSKVPSLRAASFPQTSRSYLEEVYRLPKGTKSLVRDF